MNQIATTDPRNDMITQRILYPRNRIYQMNQTYQTQQVAKLPNELVVEGILPSDQLLINPYNIFKLVIYYRPFDIYWSITVHPEKVNYYYSFNLDKLNATFQVWEQN